MGGLAGHVACQRASPPPSWARQPLLSVCLLASPALALPLFLGVRFGDGKEVAEDGRMARQARVTPGAQGLQPSAEGSHRPGPAVGERPNTGGLRVATGCKRSHRGLAIAVKQGCPPAGPPLRTCPPRS